MPPRIFAIADLHLSQTRPKPMDVFGANWKGHDQRIKQAWHEEVKDNDVVLMAGDISWAMTLPDALPDLRWIDDLPGHKIVVKGNHDYWWQSIKQVRATAGRSIRFVQNDVVCMEGMAVGGTRLWDFPNAVWPRQPCTRDWSAKTRSPEQLDRIRSREIARLRRSLEQLPTDAELRVALVHFPPLGADGEPNELTRIMTEHRVDICVFGHIHIAGSQSLAGADCIVDRTRYVLTSCDAIGFRPKCILPPSPGRQSEST